MFNSYSAGQRLNWKCYLNCFKSFNNGFIKKDSFNYFWRLDNIFFCEIFPFTRSELIFAKCCTLRTFISINDPHSLVTLLPLRMHVYMWVYIQLYRTCGCVYLAFEDVSYIDDKSLLEYYLWDADTFLWF